MNEFDWAGWTEWMPFLQLDFNSIPWDPGAYAIAASRPIHRAIEVDPVGFLDIGESSSLRKRLKDFSTCVRFRGQTGHMAGWRFAFFRFEKRFPLEELRVRWFATKTKEDAYRVEGKLLLAYVTLHCELPPLNYKFNWDAFKEVGWKVFDDKAEEKLI